MTPGNHDVPLYRLVERWHRPHELYQEITSEKLNPVLRLVRAVIAELDSTAPRCAGILFGDSLSTTDRNTQVLQLST